MNDRCSTPSLTVQALRRELRSLANPARARISQSFFKTGPGQYGAGDRFLGLTVPQIRQLAKRYQRLALPAIPRLLRSPIHEERLLALLLWGHRFAAANAAGRARIYQQYRRNTQFINNWDLVDGSAPPIVGAYLWERRQPQALRPLARSPSLWERRISILATFYWIKRGEFAPTLAIGRQLLSDREDLIHKAVGWMLREVAKGDPPTAEKFLRRYYRQMPRTMLRYAIERFPERRRQQFLRGTL